MTRALGSQNRKTEIGSTTPSLVRAKSTLRRVTCLKENSVLWCAQMLVKPLSLGKNADRINDI